MLASLSFLIIEPEALFLFRLGVEDCETDVVDRLIVLDLFLFGEGANS